MKYRIANWNLERPRKKSRKNELAVARIHEINPDVIVLTESSNVIELDGAYSVCACEEYEDYPGERWTQIWSKWPVKREIQTFDSKKTVCALIEAPFGEIIVYATILPYHGAGVKDGGKRLYAPHEYSSWQMHKEDMLSQRADWLKLSYKHPSVPLFITGDFNQTRDAAKGGYGTNEVRELLSKILSECELTCVTEAPFGDTGQLTPDPRTGRIRRNIDHICISNGWLSTLNSVSISAWDHFTDTGEYMSDHNGVYFEFEI